MKQYYETRFFGVFFFSIQNSERMQYFTINCAIQIVYLFNIQDDRSTRGILAKPLKKNFQNHLYGQPVVTLDKRQICSASR